MCCFQPLCSLFAILMYVCVCVWGEWYNYKALHMKGVDLFRFILVKAGDQHLAVPFISLLSPYHRNMHHLCVCNGIPPDHILRKIPSCLRHLGQFLLKYNLKLFVLFMNKWYVAAGVDWASTSYMKPAEKQVLIILSLWQQLKGCFALLQWSDEWCILRMWGRFPAVLRLRVHVCHVAGGGYE